MKTMCRGCNKEVRITKENTKYCQRCKKRLQKQGYLFCVVCGEAFEYDSRKPNKKVCNSSICKTELKRINNRKWEQKREKFNHRGSNKPRNINISDPYAMIEFTPGCPGAGHAQFAPVV
jgi:uncharacterized Zn finger protein (UPF0148 family)